MRNILDNCFSAILLAVLILAQPSHAQKTGRPGATNGTTSQPANVEVLSDTKGVELRPYLDVMLKKIQASWYGAMPEDAMRPQLRSGNVTLEIAIKRDGDISAVKNVESSGDTPLDVAAWNGVTDSTPLPPLPAEFTGDELRLRIHFKYNPAIGDAKKSEPTPTARSSVEVLTDAKGFDITPYVVTQLQKIRGNWHHLIPDQSTLPQQESGKTTIEFAVLQDGKVNAMRLTNPSGNTSLDRAAWGGITSSLPFAPLPPELKSDRLVLRVHFNYNSKPTGSDDRPDVKPIEEPAPSH